MGEREVADNVEEERLKETGSDKESLCGVLERKAERHRRAKRRYERDKRGERRELGSRRFTGEREGDRRG